MNILYTITLSDGNIVATNMSERQQSNIPTEVGKLTSGICPVANKQIKSLLINEDNYTIHLATYDINVTRKILDHYADACKFFVPSLLESDSRKKEKDAQNFRRLRHNLITHNTNILQELEKA